jgi:hypothetical protein
VTWLLSNVNDSGGGRCKNDKIAIVNQAEVAAEHRAGCPGSGEPDT